jgi:uncharacterized protein (DUF924 family)
MKGAIDKVHDFWFGELNTEGLSSAEFHSLWFTKNAATDERISREFGELVEQAAAGKFDDWSVSDRGLLALIVLLDQFSRNIYRNSGRAFAADSRALELAQRAIANDRHLGLPTIHKVFLYLPLEHCEDLPTQDKCVALFDALVQSAGPEVEGFAQYAVAHRDVIAQFGRFPHRNAILDRPSTPDEREYLANNGGF